MKHRSESAACEKSYKVCVIYGGNSTENEVSIVTGNAYSKALRNLGYNVLDVKLDENIVDVIKKIDEFKPDCVLNGLHGGTGENGNIQAVLNLMKIPYTHSGVLASSISMDKSVANAIFEKYGIPVPNTKIVDACKLSNKILEFPYVIKPIDGGSSVGVYIIYSEEDLKNIDWKYGPVAMIQEYIPGRELTVGVLDGKALDITEIVPKNGFYDYETKYSEGAANHVLPAEISESARNTILKYAEKAYEAVGCRGAARVDFRYDDKKDKAYILEINTQPGMTELSLFPEQAKYKGISFESLVDLMVRNACYDR